MHSSNLVIVLGDLVEGERLEVIIAVLSVGIVIFRRGHPATLVVPGCNWVLELDDRKEGLLVLEYPRANSIPSIAVIWSSAVPAHKADTKRTSSCPRCRNYR